MPRPFVVLEPTASETPVVVEVPHAGLYVDPESLATLVAPARSLASDADLYVDDLYQRAPQLGATLLVAKMSRYVCDLNRSALDIDSTVVEGVPPHSAPHGLVWRMTTEGLSALSQRLARSELERRLSLIYRPYHATLASLLERKRHRFGYAVLLAGHSMPSRGRAAHGDMGVKRADIVPGTLGATSTGAPVLRAVERVAEAFAHSLRHDDPYRGGFTTAHYGQPSQGVHAIQVEISRRLYMREDTLAINPEAFAKTQHFCEALVAELAQIPPVELEPPPAVS